MQSLCLCHTIPQKLVAQATLVLLAIVRMCQWQTQANLPKQNTSKYTIEVPFNYLEDTDLLLKGNLLPKPLICVSDLTFTTLDG